ncbi:MAG: hypothetical protein MRY72_00970 [Aquisalinus sp.]|nr:hypothetical protein [Aquisalinus sp.]
MSSNQTSRLSDLSLYWGSFLGTLLGMIIAGGVVLNDTLTLIDSVNTNNTVDRDNSVSSALVLAIICGVSFLNCLRHFIRRNIGPYVEKETIYFSRMNVSGRILLVLFYTVIVGGYGVIIALFGIGDAFSITIISLFQSGCSVAAMVLTGFISFDSLQSRQSAPKSGILFFGDLIFFGIFFTFATAEFITGSAFQLDKVWFFLLAAAAIFVIEFVLIYASETVRAIKRSIDDLVNNATYTQ